MSSLSSNLNSKYISDFSPSNYFYSLNNEV